MHHKKSGLWISPGGHVDKGEYLLQALNREIIAKEIVTNQENLEALNIVQSK